MNALESASTPSMIEPAAGDCCGRSAGSASGPEFLTIASRADLEALASRAESFSFGGRLRATVALPGWRAEDRAALETRIDKAWHECGCSLGSALALASLGAYMALYSFGIVGAGAGAGRMAWHALLAFLAGALAGKVCGIRRARLRLARELRREARGL